MKIITKIALALIMLISSASLYSQQFKADIDNASDFDVLVRVYDASNNLFGSASVPTGQSGTIGCTTGVPSYIHFVELTTTSPSCGPGGCLWSANVNTTGTCSTCTACNCWSTSTPSFSNTMSTNNDCSLMGNLLEIDISN